MCFIFFFFLFFFGLATDKQAIKVSTDFLSFGLGPRACPGRFFAVQEIKSIVALVLRRFDISTDAAGIKMPYSFAIPSLDTSGTVILTPRT
jgi:cytochrome P450